MKNLFFGVLLLFSVMSLSSQTIKVEKNYRLSGNDQKGFYPTFNVDGNLLAFTDEAYEGLNVYNFSNKSVIKVSDEPGSGWQPVFSEDGKIFYKTTVFKSQQQYNGVKSFDLQKKIVQEVLEPRRDLKQMQNYCNGIMVANGRNLIKATYGKPEKAAPPYVWSDGENLNINKSGKIEILNPVKDASGYIWASLSPNGQMILFNAIAAGTFVSDLKGNIIASLGFLNAPAWYGNEFVVGMQDRDDGHVITSSIVIMKNLAGNVTKQLSDSDQIAMYPTASAVAKKVAYNTIAGDIYILELDITK